MNSPTLSLLVKLGSIATHVEEMISANGHAFDKAALQMLLDDAEVKAWLGEMDAQVVLPTQR